MAARNGIVAARLAAAGCTGAPDALEGKASFYTAFMGDAVWSSGRFGCQRQTSGADHACEVETF